jgi:hypothetical protein
MHHMAGLHMARKCTLSAAVINITCFICVFRRKEKKLIFRMKKSNHIKRKIDVPLEQGMDNGDGNGDGDEEAAQR